MPDASFPAALTFVLITASAMACVPTARGPRDLRKVDVRAVHVALSSGRNAVCPGEAVTLDIAVDIADGEGTTRLVPTRHELDDALFEPRQLQLSSPHGAIIDGRRFVPNADVRASLLSGFVVYAEPPGGPAFAIRYPPAYECAGTLGADGIAGARGQAGRDALLATADRDTAGVGGRGQDGGEGREGGRLSVFVTWVRTSDYTRLLAARSTGDLASVTLAAPGSALRVRARGGPGGPGGRGGAGGRGVASDGGLGGEGGRGGDGGTGGIVDVVLDERFEDLAHLVDVDVEGGAGGEGGGAGMGGYGALVDRFDKDKRHAGSYEVGQRGRMGAPGPAGNRGTKGVFSISRGRVEGRFEDVAGLVGL